VAALQNTNLAVRYLAWEKLHQSGAQAEPALQKLWASDNQRFRARALWLLAKLPGKEAQYINQALEDKNTDIRITGIRAARQMNTDIMPYLKKMVADKNPQVRREVALALHNNTSPDAPALWAQLANAYDGKDRWYLEALGIAADKQWEPFLTAWKGTNGNTINTTAARDIIWRARTGSVLPLLAEGITNTATDSFNRLRYFRAFDFIEDPAKESTLLALLDNQGPNKNQIIVTTLSTLTPASLAKSPVGKQRLNEALEAVKGKQEFVELVGRYKVRNRNADLFNLAMTYPDSALGSESANLLLSLGGANLLKEAVRDTNDQVASAALKTLSKGGSKEAMAMMASVINDKNIKLATRQQAVTMLGTGWNESEYLLGLVKSGKISKELEPTAAVALSGTYRKDIRQEALKYLGTASASGGKQLAPINVLVKQTGNATAGRQVFSSVCATCHKVGNDGVRFGPDLSYIGGKLAKDAMYVAILHPDAGISFGYEGFIFDMKDGSKQAGIISSETEDVIELLQPGGVKKTLKKTDVASRKAMENSMMPGNLQMAMSQQDLVNLVEFLSAQKAGTTAGKQVVSR
jgi:putative heme-binding domain-containing protein